MAGRPRRRPWTTRPRGSATGATTTANWSTSETVPGSAATTASLGLESRLESALESRGSPALYAHQTAAVRALRDGENAVLSTPTASGKSLAYTVPAFERAMDHGGRTLHLAPTNALIADQHDALPDLAADLLDALL